MEPEGSLPHSQVPRQLSLSWTSSIQSIPPTPHFLKIHLNIILPSTPRSPKWSFPLKFRHQNPVCTSLLPTRATCPAHLIILDLITRTILGEQDRYWTRGFAVKSLFRRHFQMSEAHLTHRIGLFQYSLGTRLHNSLSRTLTFLPSHNLHQFKMYHLL